jgi:hypothetical protein
MNKSAGVILHGVKDLFLSVMPFKIFASLRMTIVKAV